MCLPYTGNARGVKASRLEGSQVRQDSHLVQVEHDIQLAYGTEIAVQRLHIRVHELKHDQRVFVAVHASQHKEGRVASVNHLNIHAAAEERVCSDVPVEYGITVAGALRSMREQTRSSRLVVAVLNNRALLVAARQALAHDFALQDSPLFNRDVLREAAGDAAARQFTILPWALTRVCLQHVPRSTAPSASAPAC